jgi:hypothetical protein
MAGRKSKMAEPEISRILSADVPNTDSKNNGETDKDISRKDDQKVVQKEDDEEEDDAEELQEVISKQSKRERRKSERALRSLLNLEKRPPSQTTKDNSSSDDDAEEVSKESHSQGNETSSGAKKPASVFENILTYGSAKGDQYLANKTRKGEKKGKNRVPGIRRKVREAKKDLSLGLPLLVDPIPM